MTKSKAIRIIKELMGKHGEDFRLFVFYDYYLKKLDEAKDDVKGGTMNFFVTEKRYSVRDYTLKDLLSDCEDTMKDLTEVPDMEYVWTSRPISFGMAIRQMEKNPGYFKNEFYPVVNHISMGNYQKFCDENREALKKVSEERRRLIGVAMGIGRAFNQDLFY